MGQYLAVGLITKLSVSKKQAEKAKITLDEAVQNLTQNTHFRAEVYDFSAEEETWVWTLKKEIWESELYDFLKIIYPLLYINKEYADYDEVIEKLSQTDPTSWMELANKKSFTAFQMDKYGASEWLSFDEKPFKPELTVNYISVALAMEGKIMMETYGSMFNFFKICVQKSFAEFQLSKAIRIYITG